MSEYERLKAQKYSMLDAEWERNPRTVYLRQQLLAAEAALAWAMKQIGTPVLRRGQNDAYYAEWQKASAALPAPAAEQCGCPAGALGTHINGIWICSHCGKPAAPEKCSHCESGELLKGGQRCTYCGRGCGKPAAPAGKGEGK